MDAMASLSMNLFQSDGMFDAGLNDVLNAQPDGLNPIKATPSLFDKLPLDQTFLFEDPLAGGFGGFGGYGAQSQPAIERSLRTVPRVPTSPPVAVVPEVPPAPDSEPEPHSTSHNQAHAAAALPTSTPTSRRIPTPPTPQSSIATKRSRYSDEKRSVDSPCDGHRGSGGSSAHAAATPGRSRPSRHRVQPKKYQHTYCELSESDEEQRALTMHTPHTSDDEEEPSDRQRNKGKASRKRSRPAPLEHGAESDDNDDDADPDPDAGVDFGDMSSDADVLAGMLDPKEERALREQLKHHLVALDRCGSESKGLSPMEKKKLRNRKASRVSRLRKKLSVFDLQRKYQASLCEVDQYRSALESVVSQLRKYQPGFHCEALTSVPLRNKRPKLKR